MSSEITITVKGNEYSVECESFYQRLDKICSKCENKLYVWAIKEVFNIKNTLTDNHLDPKSPLARHVVKRHNKKKEEESFCLACDKHGTIREFDELESLIYE